MAQPVARMSDPLETPATTVRALLAEVARCSPAAPALVGVDQPGLSFEGLLRQVDEMGRALAGAGLRPGDTVAVVLPNGVGLAVAFLGIAAHTACAPLNPAYTAAEFRFYLEDLGARALVTADGTSPAAVEAARELGIPVRWFQAVPEVAGEGRWELAGVTGGTGPSWTTAAEDVALVLHTSGTTSRPKLVPLTQANLVASARQIARSLDLTPADRSLNVMPLFHVHGLMAALLAPLASGGSVVCTPGFQAEAFGRWLEEFRPTWFTAVPTMHQALLTRWGSDPALPAGSLRFVRSCSAALAPTVMATLEGLFRVPVVEAYGMTEAAHQMATNPLPPQVRKPGSVGRAAGPEVGILDEAGNLLPAGTTGEVAIRGANVTRGYVANPAANASAFTHGWFRTGDQGYLDADGYLFLTGRLKEIVNRGGEKVSPREVDEALLAHPGVAQAVAFGVPHPTLGEDLAAAVVTRDPAGPGEAELRRHLLERLPAFKVPSRIVLLRDIPKGPTGKVQRIGLAAKLGDALRVAFEPPAAGLESEVAALFAEMLGVGEVGRNTNFFAAGGDSIRASRVVARLVERHGIEATPALVFRHPTPAQLAPVIEAAVAEQVARLEEELAQLPPEEVERLLRETGAADPRP